MRGWALKTLKRKIQHHTMDGEMKILRSLALVALVLPLAACGDDPPPPIIPPVVVGIINGQVTIEGEALQGVTVTLGGPSSQTATSAADGKYSFQNVLAGTYAISLSNLPNDATFTNPSQQVTITTNGQVVTADFQGNFIRTAAITGLVIIDEKPISGISVAIGGTETQSPQSTNNLGAFSFTGLRSGAYSITITSPNGDVNFGSLTQNVTLAVGQAAALTFAGFVPQEPTVSINSITAGGTLFPVNPNAIAGQIDVVVNFDAGDETAESLAVWVRNGAGTEIELDRQDFSSSGSGAGAASQAVFSENTAALMADGVTPIYLNGEYAIFARLVTVEGTTTDGALRDPLTFANLDRLTVTNTTPAGSGVVSKARTWFGGTAGATYEARAIIYSTDIAVASLGVTATVGGAVGSTLNATGSGLVSFGSGSGAETIVAGNPATFTVTATNNAGIVEDAFVQNFDSNANGVFDTGDFGQTLAVTSVMDTNGVERIPDIQSSNPAAVVPLNGQLFDFVAPVVDQAAAVDTNLNGFTGDTGDAPIVFAASELTFTAGVAAPNLDFDNSVGGTPRWFSAGVGFAVSNVNELGVGFAGGSGRGPVAQTDMNLNVNDLLVPTTALFTNVASSDDLTERSSAGYELEVTSIVDALGNSTAMGSKTGLTGVVSTLEGIASDNSTGPFGVDFNAVAYSAQAPVPNATPASATGDPLEWIILNNTNAGYPTPLAGGATNPLHTILYSVDDPTLADTNAPAGINSGGVDISIAFAAVGGVTTTLTDAAPAVVATVPAAPFVNLATITAVTVDASASLTGAAVNGAGGNTAYAVTATTTDQATGANSASQPWFMVLVDTPPTTAMVNPPPANVASSQAQLTFTIQGSVTNQSVVLVAGAAAVPLPLSAINVVLTLAGVDGACGTADDTDPVANFVGAVGAGGTTGTALNTAGPPFSRGFSVTTTEGANFSVDMTVSNPGGAGTAVDYCFQINTSDSAVDNAGTADPLNSTASTETIITWN
jgi:Prealbumin-like fold domain